MARSKFSTDDQSDTITEPDPNLPPAPEPVPVDPDAPPVPVNEPPTDDEIAKAQATRDASDPNKPSAPDVPSLAALDYVPPVEDAAPAAPTEEASTTGLHPDSGIDARLHLAQDLAKRGLTFASVNDLAKAVVLLVDLLTTPTPGDSPIAVAAARGEVPALL